MADRIDRALARVLDGVLAVLLVGLVGAVFTQVFSRYVLQASVPWTEEVARYLLIYLTFVGAAVAVREHTHLRVDFLVVRLPHLAQRVIGMAMTAGILISGALLVVYGYSYTERAVGTISPAIGQSIAWIYAVMPVAGALMVAYAIPSLVRQFAGKEEAFPHAHQPEAAAELG